MVYVPFGWDRFPPSQKDLCCAMTPQDAGCWMCEASARLDAKTCSPRATPKRLAKACDCSHVALTRASSSVVMHWPPPRRTPGAHRCIVCCRPGKQAQQIPNMPTTWTNRRS